jgi:DNA adenine methylase
VPSAEEDLARCEREIAACSTAYGDAGVLMGYADWHVEKKLIEKEMESRPEILKAPFPYFGGKSRAAAIVWDRFGDVNNYVEPFAGSLAVLLGRPHTPQIETVNDIDCALANFWRALSKDPEGVAEYADWPVNEADLHARHLWLVNNEEFRERMKTDPEFYDVKVAGWWVWGISQWIGSGWCSHQEWKQLPHLGPSSGVHRKLPHLGDAGQGVSRRLPHLGSAGSGNGIHGEKAFQGLYAYMYDLAARLRRVRVCCGDWKRVTGPSVTFKHGVTGVFLDPPYDMRVVSDGTDGLYATHDNDVSAEVRAWALENGLNPLLRIALCGYEGEHGMPESWECVYWKTQGGFGGQREDQSNENAKRERIWFSPHCLRQPTLFE